MVFLSAFLLHQTPNHKELCSVRKKTKNADKKTFHQLYLGLEAGLSNLEKPWDKQHST